MTPLDDELRRALSDQAGDLTPAADPMVGIEARARSIHRRRTALAAGGSALAVALIVGIPVALTANQAGTAPPPFATSGPSESPTDAPTAAITEGPSPVGTPTRRMASAPSQWDFRGDLAAATQLTPTVKAAFASLRAKAGDPDASRYLVKALWFGQLPSGVNAGVWLSGLEGRVDHAITYLNSPGGSRIVADQPVGPATPYIDALLPGDPANFILVVGSPGPETKVTYVFQEGPRAEPMTDGVTIFGRGEEAYGDALADCIAVNQATCDGLKFHLAPHQVDAAIDGRLSDPAGAADWVYESWLANDRHTAAEHTTATATEEFFNSPFAGGEPGDPAPATLSGCRNTSGNWVCAFRSARGSGELTLSGGASAGYRVVGVNDNGIASSS